MMIALATGIALVGLSVASNWLTRTFEGLPNPNSPEKAKIRVVHATRLSGEDRYIRFPAERPMVILAVEPNCDYCKINWPWWRKIQSRVGKIADLEVLDVSSTFTADDARTLGLRLDLFLQIDQAEARRIKVSLTPTTAVIGKDGVVTRAWIGVFNEARLGELERIVRDGS